MSTLGPNAPREVRLALEIVRLTVERDAALIAPSDLRSMLRDSLRIRGWTHDDDEDPRDLYWAHDKVGVRPLLVAVASEIDRDRSSSSGFTGWDTYPVSLGVPAAIGIETPAPNESTTT